MVNRGTVSVGTLVMPRLMKTIEYLTAKQLRFYNLFCHEAFMMKVKHSWCICKCENLEQKQQIITGSGLLTEYRTSGNDIGVIKSEMRKI